MLNPHDELELSKRKQKLARYTPGLASLAFFLIQIVNAGLPGPPEGTATWYFSDHEMMVRSSASCLSKLRSGAKRGVS